MQGVLHTGGKPALIKIRITVKGLPAGAEVEITDFMFQPDQAVSGWIPHVTELPWSAGMTYLNTAPGGEVVYWDDVEGKPVVFPPGTHKHAIGDVSGLRAELDGKQPSGNYATSAALTSGLSGKANTTHTHTAAQTTSGVFNLARIPVMDAAHIGDNAVSLSSLTAALRDLLDQYESTIAALQSEVGGAKLAYGSKNGDDLPGSYPDGYSTGLFRVSQGWPSGYGNTFWTVVSFKASGYDQSIVQYAYAYKAQGIAPLFRTAIDPATWGPWGPIGG